MPDSEENPMDAFALVANETRLEIIKALGDERELGPRPKLSFSELRSRIDTDTRSSQLSYHLDQLLGHFVRQTDDGNYQMRPEGTVLYWTLQAGTYHRQDEMPSTQIDLDCYYCNGGVEAVYRDGLAIIRCSECDNDYYLLVCPPNVTKSDARVVATRIDHYYRHLLLAYTLGTCPFCAGSVDTKFYRPSDAPIEKHRQELDVLVGQSCTCCGSQHYLNAGLALVYHPALISFCYERGLDILSTPLWDLEFAVTDRCITVRSTEPWEVVFRLPLGDETLELVVDEDLNVPERAIS